MLILPSTEDSLLVRTTFGNEDAWVDALSTVLTENEDGFRAYVKVVDDIAWDRVGWEQVRQAALAGNEHASVLFIVDSAALESGYPIHVIDLSHESRRPFRCIARELWGVDNNPKCREHGLGGVRRKHRQRRCLQGFFLTILA